MHIQRGTVSNPTIRVSVMADLAGHSRHGSVSAEITIAAIWEYPVQALAVAFPTKVVRIRIL